MFERHKLYKTLRRDKFCAYLVFTPNTVDMSLAIQKLMSQGEVIHKRHLAALSPYPTRRIKKCSDYIVNLRNVPEPLEAAIHLPVEIFEM